MKKRYTFKEVKEATTLAGYKLTAPMYSASGKCEIEVMEGFTAPVPVISEVSKLTDVMEFITSYPAVKATEVIAETNVTSEVEPVESLEDIKVGTDSIELSDTSVICIPCLDTYSTNVASGSLSEVLVKSGCATTRWHYKFKCKIADKFVTRCFHVPKYLVEVVRGLIEQSAPIIRVLEVLGKAPKDKQIIAQICAMNHRWVYGLVRNQVIEKIEVFTSKELYEARAQSFADTAGVAQWEKINLSEIAGVMTYPKYKISWRHRQYWTDISEEVYLKLKPMIGV